MAWPSASWSGVTTYTPGTSSTARSVAALKAADADTSKGACRCRASTVARSACRWCSRLTCQNPSRTHTAAASAPRIRTRYARNWTPLLRSPVRGSNLGATRPPGSPVRCLRIGIVDLVTKGPTRALWARVMHPNMASIMPQVVGVWCEEEGHRVSFVCYTGFEDLMAELPRDIDLLFVTAFSQAAQTAYAISNLFRRRGTVTALGGPHARCYPEDAARYFDYVFGFTDKPTLKEALDDCRPHRPVGIQLSASQQPAELPGMRQRWRFIEPTIAKAPAIKIVPMLGSLGCPYTCSFCIDSTVDYQPLGFEQITEDLKFLRTKLERPRVAWHDPNFGVRFNDYMDAIEAAGPPGCVDHIAESSLSLLSEPHLKRID